MSYRFEIEAGKSKRFPVGGKYCEEDIIVTALGGSDAPVTPEYSEGLLIGLDDWWSWWAVKGYGTWDGEHLVIPPYTDEGEPIEGIAFEALDNNTKIKSVTFPETMVFIPGDIFYNCPNLTHLYMPYITRIASITMLGSSFEYVQLRDILEIGGNAFSSCKYCVFDFTDCSAIPTLDSYGAGEEFGTDPVILVPENLLEEWKQATNWTLYADYIVSYATEADIARGKAAYVDEELITGTMPPASEILGDTGFLSLTWVDVTIGANTITLGDAAHSYLNELAGGYLCAAALLENPTVENQLVIVSGSMKCSDVGGNLSDMRTGYRYRSGGLQLTVLQSQYLFVLKEGTRYRLWVLNPNTTNIAPY